MEGFPLWLKIVVYVVVGATVAYPIFMVVSSLLG
jgi:hypothetical protein